MTASNQTQLQLNNCGCCEGLAVETPVGINNRPGLSAIAYRAGTQTRFKASMIAGLSESGLAELRKLRTRDNDDFTIALLDAWAVVCDVLAFYQERIANESYLLTATERASIINLARLIGYELRPGVAAGTYLAFTLETGEGAPAAVTIGKGVQVQSIPGPEEKPQTFETIEEIDAQGEWNAMPARMSRSVRMSFGAKEAYLEGVDTNLKAGDGLLFVGEEREQGPKSKRWDFRLLQTVVIDAERNCTRVTWEKGLGNVMPSVQPAARPKVFAIRLRASVFGYSAPDWRTMLEDWKRNYLGVAKSAPLLGEWPDFVIFTPADKTSKVGGGERQTIAAPTEFSTDTIDLNAVYQQINQGSWLLLSAPSYTELYQVTKVEEAARADFTLTSKTSRVTLSGELAIFRDMVRTVTVFAQSEELALAEMPETGPVQGDTISLDLRIVKNPVEGVKVISSGKLQRVQVAATARNVTFNDADGVLIRNLEPDEILVVLAPAPDEDAMQNWRLLDLDGVEGYASAPQAVLNFIASRKEDPLSSEVVTLKAVTLEDSEHTRLELAQALTNVYERSDFAVSANVALGTHGETVANEVLGSGDPGQTYQRFTLSESPLTYTSADNPSGGETSLEVRVNDLKWAQVPTLFDRGPRERVYATHTDDNQTTTLQFGDGVIGARLPMGNENVTATYRKGIGREGLVKANQLSLLMTRPLGVQSVLNPLPATGAQDPQSLADARVNSPLTVLTLDRIVSLSDYEDFASSFSGIGKALVTWTWNVHARGVFVTVAGIDGAPVGQKLHATMVSAMMKCADAHVPITVKSYRAVTFKLVADVKVDPDYIEEKVLAAIETAMRSGFSFAARAFGQPVTLSEVTAVIQNVAGVVAVDVNKLYRSDEPEGWNTLLVAEAPRAGIDAGVPAAELLTLDPAPFELGVMP